MRTKLLIFGTFFFLTLLTVAQTDTGKAMNTMLIKVNKDIYMLQAKGGNIGLSFGNEGVFMIDDQYAEGIELIQEEIKKKSKKPVKFLVNTHFHGDHTGGNAAMAETGTIIFAQDNVRKRLLETIAKETKKIPQETLPVITFSDDLTFYYNKEKIYFFHVHNAHTDGDAMVYFTKSNVLHAGDVFFNGKYPYIDTKNGGSLKGYIAALDKAILVINDETKIIPGHGKVGSLNDLRKTKNLLVNSFKKVTMHYMKKKTEDEVAKMKDITADYDAQGYGKGFITTEAFLRMIYQEVDKQRGGAADSRDAKNKQAADKIEQMQRDLKDKKQ